MVASILQVCGLVCIVIALALWIPLLGLVAAGCAFVAVGVALEGRNA